MSKMRKNICFSRNERERGNKVQQLTDGTVRRTMFLLSQVVEFLDRRIIQSFENSDHARSKFVPPTLSRPTISMIASDKLSPPLRVAMTLTDIIQNARTWSPVVATRSV